MTIDPTLSEWLNLILRWVHVFAGIMWIGTTYYFTWLDARLTEEEKAVANTGNTAQVWMVHSGGFYVVEKRKMPDLLSRKLHWFRWEALVTWLAGMALLVLVYYSGSGLVDPDVADISKRSGIAIGLGAIVAGWVIYDAAVRSALSKSPMPFAICALGMIALAAWGLMQVFSARAAYIHVGAIFGTVMTANVWDHILPAQRKMIAAAAAGMEFDASLAAQAKLRSKHNTFMALPVVFIMLSNHYPVATYGNRYGWQVLVALVVVGWIAASVIRKT